MEQPGPKLAVIWDVGVTGRLIYYAVTLAPAVHLCFVGFVGLFVGLFVCFEKQ